MAVGTSGRCVRMWMGPGEPTRRGGISGRITARGLIGKLLRRERRIVFLFRVLISEGGFPCVLMP